MTIRLLIAILSTTLLLTGLFNMVPQLNAAHNVAQSSGSRVEVKKVEAASEEKPKVETLNTTEASDERVSKLINYNKTRKNWSNTKSKI